MGLVLQECRKNLGKIPGNIIPSGGSHVKAQGVPPHIEDALFGA
jgi:hypothetical protein